MTNPRPFAFPAPGSALLACGLAVSLVLGSCRATPEEEPPPQNVEASSSPSPAAPAAPDISVPSTGFAAYDRAEVERLRRDAAWRSAAETDWRARTAAPASPGPAAPAAPGAAAPPARAGQAPPAAGSPTPSATPLPLPAPGAQAAPPAGSQPGARAGATPPAAGGKAASPEKFEQITAESVNGPHPLPIPQDGGGPSALAAQILLGRASFSPGVMDGHWGKNTEKAVFWLQVQSKMEPTGVLDQATWDQLTRRAGTAPPVAQATVTQQDLAGPFAPLPDDVYEQAKLKCLCYASPLEMLAERHHTTEEVLQQLNPGVDFGRLAAGASYLAPVVPPSPKLDAAARDKSPVARLVVSKAGFYTQALDAQGNILLHFPSTLGSEYDPSASGTLKITGIAPNPTFHYQPTLFADVSDDKPEAQLPAGPNAPVGVVWIDLSKPHHGIHGTAVPETIGYTSSHGCVRLTNWDALRLASVTKVGTPVEFKE
jgi:lipoprotein-anchoring transpeptidase ErfK/SrfK